MIPCRERDCVFRPWTLEMRNVAAVINGFGDTRFLASTGCWPVLRSTLLRRFRYSRWRFPLRFVNARPGVRQAAGHNSLAACAPQSCFALRKERYRPVTLLAL